jgi:ABC-2 type transport system permease protein
MLSTLQLHLARVFLKIFLRDRQSLFFSLFFPAIFMTVFGFANNNEADSVRLAVANNAGSPVAGRFIDALESDELFDVSLGDEEKLRSGLLGGEYSLLIVLPAAFNNAAAGAELTLVVDAAQVRELGLIMPVLEQKLLAIEHELRGTTPLFTLTLEDVKARSQSYLAFLLPGLMAFTLMQLSIAGSGFNIVEYRRKGILKRLFVTPIKPSDFITAIVLARLIIVLVQLTVLLLYAVFVLNISLVGSYSAFYFIILLATLIFLCLGFCLGSIAKTQQAIMAIGNLVIFPQMFLSGVFYPIESMPALLQPLARVLPLSSVASAMREIANNGATLLEILPSLIGIAVWLILAFVLATRLFVWKEVAH